MSYDIFISYRRKGGDVTAKHLYDLLTRDGYSVSFDVDTLRSGDFDVELLKRIDECTDFIVILNEGVFDRMLTTEKQEDWLRNELAYALKKKKNIIPIMLAGFSEFPKNLPEDVVDISRKNGIIHNMKYFDAFYDKLKKEFLLSEPTATRNDCILKILTNQDCFVFIDKKFTCIAKENQITKIDIEQGVFLVEFINQYDKNNIKTLNFSVQSKEEFLEVKLKKVSPYKIENELFVNNIEIKSGESVNLADLVTHCFIEGKLITSYSLLFTDIDNNEINNIVNPEVTTKYFVHLLNDKKEDILYKEITVGVLENKFLSKHLIKSFLFSLLSIVCFLIYLKTSFELEYKTLAGYAVLLVGVILANLGRIFASHFSDLGNTLRKRAHVLSIISMIILFIGIIMQSTKSSKQETTFGSMLWKSIELQVDNSAINNISKKMIYIEGGKYTMGYSDNKMGIDEMEQIVIIADFAISASEVTEREWESIMGYDTSCLIHNNSWDSYPVANVSWEDIVGTLGKYMEINGIKYYENGFIYKLNEKTGKKYRLPTEAEWEYAACGGKYNKNYKYSGNDEIDSIAWYYENSGDKFLNETQINIDSLSFYHCKVHPIAQKASNELGIYDMSGNVWEWCSDWYEKRVYKESTTKENPKGPKNGDTKVLRGGSWKDPSSACRNVNRFFLGKDKKNNSIGFRLAHDI